MTAENLTDLPQKNDELTDEQLDKVAGGIRSHPEQYINPDGTVNQAR